MYNQSGVIPYKILDGKIQILLITSIKKKRWIVPKGYVDYNLTPFESAKKEAFEEAGIIGSNETIELGSYNSNKSPDCCHIIMYSLFVEQLLDDYPEKNLRKREWVEVQDALKLIENDSLKIIVKKIEELIKIPKNNF